MKKAMELSRCGDPVVKAEVTPICMELMTTLEQVASLIKPLRTSSPCSHCN